MAWLDAIAQRFAQMTFAQAAVWLTVINVAMFALSVGGGELAVRVFRTRRIGELPDPIEAKECWLATLCVLLNSGVAVAGWCLWRRGWIVLRFSDSPGGRWRWIIDTLVLLLAMDLLMYVFHRIAHLKWVFPIVHATHHHYDRPRPLSLFVLNPFEVLGFGALWLALLCVYTASWTGIVVYLALNLLFGTIGHLGVEPLPARWQNWPLLRHLGSSTFHANHHDDRGVNFGLYTDLWIVCFGRFGNARRIIPAAGLGDYPRRAIDGGPARLSSFAGISRFPG